MPPIGTGQVIQTSGEVARVQEALQQQMDHRRRSVQSQQEKTDDKKLRSVIRGEQKDKVSVHAREERREHQEREGRDADDAGHGGEQDDAEKAEDSGKSEAGADGGGHLDITI